jgi:hypothetical protein
VANLAVPDYFTIGNALFGGIPPVPATVSFLIHWGHPTARVRIHNPALDFGGLFVRNAATIWWRSQQAGFAFESAPAATSASYFAEIGHERNGLFFPHA